MGDFYNQTRSGRNHFVGIDWLRGIAAFFIVGCHIGLLDRTVSGTALTHFCDMNVGVFAAISGFLLYGSVEASSTNIKQVLGKRIGRLLPMYIIWSLFYLIVRWGADRLFGSGGFSRECAQGLSFWGWVVFGGGAACTLWFLINLLYAQIVICLLYCIVPRLISNAWLVALCSLVMLWWSVVDHGYLGYYTARLFSFVLLGWGLALRWRKLLKSPTAWGTVALVCLTGHFLLDGVVPKFMLDFICVIPLIMFALLQCGNQETSAGHFLSSTSMGVYLWHPLFVVGVQRMITKVFSVPYSAAIILLAWMGTYVLALITTVVVRLTPFRRFQG